MAIKFTDEQEKVIQVRNKNVLVSAAAGSGKTAVLVERIVNMVCNPESNVDIDRLLVVTFTRAAASEMRERIHKRISEQLNINPESAHIQKQYALVHRAMITTIDSFCQNVLRNHFQEVGIDPDFRVMDEAEKGLLKKDVIADLLEEKYAQGDEEFLDTVSFFAPKGVQDSAFEKMIIDLFDYSESFAWPVKFLEERKADYENVYEKLVSDSGEIDPLGSFFRKYLKELFAGYLATLKKYYAVCLESDGPEAYAKTVAEDISFLESLVNTSDLQKISDELAFYHENAGKFATIKAGSCDMDKKEAVQKGRNAIKALLKELYETFFSPNLAQLCEYCDKSDRYIKNLIDLTLQFRNAFQDAKADKKLVDFSDLEHMALKVLVDEESGEPTSVALEYREYFREIMIDEYQDSNEVQEVILGAISSKDPAKYDCFMVGDVKQSIYGFRQARPALFLDKFNRYPKEEGCERIDLSKNFRSRAEVLNATNDVFTRIMRGVTGKIEYDDAAKLYLGADYIEDEGFKAQMYLLDSKLSEELSENGDEDFNQLESEAEVIAKIIRDLMQNGKVTARVKTEDGEKQELRCPNYGDIVVLHRSPSNIAEAMSTVFEREGIPISVSQGGGYFSVSEVSQVLCLVRAINNPFQDIPLYGALVSAFGGFTASEVANMRARGKHEKLWETVKKEAPDFAEKINRYKHLATYRSIRELLQIIFDEHDYLEYVAAMPAGAKRKANVEMLLSYATSFEKTSYFGLYHFVRYIDQLEKYTEDKTAEADVLGENANVVRLMSIHKSKGLEFPIAILAGMGKQFNGSDETASIVRDNELGIGCDYINTRHRTKHKTIRKNLIAKKLREDNRAEELRLLYVAMTRAKEKLIMGGSIKDAQKLTDDIHAGYFGTEQQLSYTDFVNSHCYFDLVLPVVGNCAIDVNYADASYVAIEEIKEQISLDEKKSKLSDAINHADIEALNEIDKRLSYEYPFKHLREMYTKATVSELKMASMLEENEESFNQFESRENAEYIPSFRKEKEEITGPVRGDAYHRLMEIFDFDRSLGRILGGRPDTLVEFRKAFSENEKGVYRCISEFVDEEVREKRFKEVYDKAVNISKIKEFAGSDLAYRMWTASQGGKLWREQPFVLSISASKVNKEFPFDEKLIIQGIIDAFFEEEGEIVLLDYKTDNLDLEADFISRYKTQLDYYQEAIEKLTGKKVKERILYSFHMGKMIVSVQ